jgi:hypothetical protein
VGSTRCEFYIYVFFGEVKPVNRLKKHMLGKAAIEMYDIIHTTSHGTK